MTVKRVRIALGIVLVFAALFVFLWAPRHNQLRVMDAYADTLFRDHSAGTRYEGRYSYTSANGREHVITATVCVSDSETSAHSPREQLRDELLLSAKGLGVELPEHFMDKVSITLSK